MDDRACEDEVDGRYACAHCEDVDQDTAECDHEVEGNQADAGSEGGDAIDGLETLGYVDYYDVVGNTGEEGEDQGTHPGPVENEAPGKDWLWAPFFAGDYAFVDEE